MKDSLRINFVMSAAPLISGGPLAILEYANRFIERGHDVSITIYPDNSWDGDNPFPWFKFKGPIHYKKIRLAPKYDCSLTALSGLERDDPGALGNVLLHSFGLDAVRESLLRLFDVSDRALWDYLLRFVLTSMPLMEAMPECDLNIATRWDTVYPVLFSHKGTPVYFMQHYEEVFYPPQPDSLMSRLLARLSYSLPVHKVANSSWLRDVIKAKFGQEVPFSNNGLELSDFSPRAKASSIDGAIRVFTYSRPDDWKGFGDAVAAMSKVRLRYGARVQWHVFGYQFPELPENNPYARYQYHPKLSFAALAELYATSDIALCPSWFESFPLPPLEAMASGTAVITTAYGTEDYAFDGQNALVIGSRDVEAMYRAVSRLIEDEALREKLAAAGLTTAQEFNWDRAVVRREQILLDIHHGKTKYDLLKPAGLGLSDSFGIDFERAPLDVKVPESGMFWQEGTLYLLHAGVKRPITNADLVPTLVEYNLRYLTVDNLTFIRTPTGFPISRIADLPEDVFDHVRAAEES
jgi:glycosyltransferase involved in cell wall biosynthesis